ncbi:hypothetical protein C8F01DRAFT_1100994 [Mycena amicta]|nr:hypothetical protein C8F01DRAFT_1100994 [Mycena amicta]
MGLLDIPTELLIRILSCLDSDSIQICRNTCPAFRAIIQSSSALQYIMECRGAGVMPVVDNPSLAPISDRLSALRAREAAFVHLKPTWATEIPIPFDSNGGNLELKGGFYFLGEQSRKALWWVPLPVERDEKVEWKRREIVAEGETAAMIDFNVAVEEHDLLIVAKYSWTGANASSGVITLHPYCISTMQLHPLANGPIEVISSRLGQPAVTLEVVGDVVVVIVGFHLFSFAPEGSDLQPDRILVYEWKTGLLRKEASAAPRSYYGQAFLTPDIVMIPNMLDSSLELWDISASQSITPMLTLYLPSPKGGVLFFTTRCCPNPSAYENSAGFALSSDPLDAIIFLQVFDAAPDGAQYLLLMRRQALLEKFQQHVRPMPPVVTTSSEPLALPYSAWGESICRWIKAEDIAMHTIISTVGQRCVMVKKTPHGRSVFMLDFNVHPTHLQRLNGRELWEEKGNALFNSNENRRETSPSRWELVPPEDDVDIDYGMFTEPVGSRLPCYTRQLSSETENDFSTFKWAGMDEAWIIGVKTDPENQERSLEVLYFG